MCFPHSDLVVDAQPHWTVDLEEAEVVGTIRVWNRENEIDTNEEQTVTTTASDQLLGTFRLTFEHHGVNATTDDISVSAVAEVHDETNSTSPGQGFGESMQAKLQALSNIGQVEVRRSGPDFEGGYSWTIVFVSEPGTRGVHIVRVFASAVSHGSGSVFPCTAGNVKQLRVAMNNITSPDNAIALNTIVEGSSTIWFAVVTRRLPGAPCLTLIVSFPPQGGP